MRTLAGLLLAVLVANSVAAEDEVVSLDKGQSVRVALRVELDGKPLSETWDTAFRSLFAHLDRNSNGVLDPAEATRAPAAVRVRQLSWGYFFTHPADAPAWADLAGKENKVGLPQLAAYYRRQGVGGVQVGVGVAPATEALTRALLRRLDGDGDSKVSADEWQAADRTLAALDLNEDEVLTPAELVEGLSYPGAQGNNLLTPIGENRAADARLTVRLGRRAPGRLALEWQAGEMSLSAGDGTRLEVETAGSRVTLGVGVSELVDDFRTARKTATERFPEADANGDGIVDRAEAARSTYTPLRALFTAADRDADDRLARTEWDGWLDVLEGLTAGQVVLAVVDQGPGLFELLDADRDGRLSVRELRSAGQRLKTAGCLEKEQLRTEKLPRHLLAAVSVGLPRLPPPHVRRTGPEWFRATDRNGDGDVSAREWVGSAEDFRTADRDGDGLLSPQEAERAVPKKPQSK